MSPAAKREYMKAIYDRRHRARKKAKKPILDERCKVYACRRKSAIRLQNGSRPTEEAPRRKGGGNTVYGSRVISILEVYRRAIGCLWSRRLKEGLRVWLPSIRKHCAMTPEEERRLMAMSPSTMDRRLKAKRELERKRLYATAKPGKEAAVRKINPAFVKGAPELGEHWGGDPSWTRRLRPTRRNTTALFSPPQTR